MFNKFFSKIKNRTLGGTQAGFRNSAIFGPYGVSAGMAYDLFKNRNRGGSAAATAPSTSTPVSNYGTVSTQAQPPAATYNSNKARTGYNSAVSDLQAYKAKNSQPVQSFDPTALASQLSDKRSKDEDGEDDGPSPMEQYLAEVQRIQAGKFKYSSTEKAQLENIKKTGREIELRQSRVNDNYMGGTLQGELRSGRSRYAQELADDAMINAMQVGTDAINEADLETSKAVVDLEGAIKEQRLRDVAEKYGLLQEQDANRQSAYNDLQDRLLEYSKLQNTITNQSRGSVENDYNLAISQGYRGTYRDFLKEMESNNLLGKYAPVSSSTPSYYGGSTGIDRTNVTVSG